MEEIKNKRISRDVIFQIASLIYEEYARLKELHSEYKTVSDDYHDPRNKIVRDVAVVYRPSFSIDIRMENQDETFSDLDRLKEYLDNHSSAIEKISIHFYSEYRINTSFEEHYNAKKVSEDVSLTFRDDSIHTLFNYENAQSNYTTLRDKIERLLNNAPASYDDIIAKKYFRKNLPSLSIGLLLGIVCTIALYIFTKQNSSYELLNKFVDNVVFVPVMLGVFIFIGLIIPGKNHYLYNAMNIKRKYAGWTKSSGNIYKDDVKSFLNNSEVEIGKFHNRGKLRVAIEENYNNAKRMVLVELIVFVVLFFVL